MAWAWARVPERPHCGYPCECSHGGAIGAFGAVLVMGVSVPSRYSSH